MSLAHLLRSADARFRLDLVRPASPRLEGTAAPPARLSPALAAAAVANGIRVELARREPRARGEWRAERAPQVLESVAPDMVAAAERALAFATHVPARETVDWTEAAERALQLARLDAVVRAGYVDAAIGAPENPEDVAEVAAMLERVPWAELGAPAVAPPHFATFADALPDAEPDALAGGTLLMANASRAPRIGEDELQSLVARLLVARAEWGAEEAAARVRTLGVLLARHGRLWRVDASTITEHEAFPAVEKWFLKRLNQARREAAPKADGDAPAKKGLPKWVKKRFAKKAPMTHPDGKAVKKKQNKAPREPREPQEVRATRRDPREEGPDGQPRTPRKQRPDWRKNSPWRRERGL